MTGHTEDYIWNKLPLAIGLQYYAQWWKDYNDKRRMSSFGKVAEILVLRADSGETLSERSLIV